MTADQAYLAALRDLRAAFEELQEPSMIIGGLAAIARGVPRLTVDIDATVWAEGLDVDRLLTVLSTHNITGRVPDTRQFALDRQVLLLRHVPTDTPLEITLARLPFEREALERASSVEIGNVSVSVATAEDLIVYKAVAWRGIDQTDIEQLLLRHGHTVNLERIRTMVSQFAEALDEPERIEKFDALVRRALGPPQ